MIDRYRFRYRYPRSRGGTGDCLVNKVLVKALKEKASDIHIEPQEVRIRFRKRWSLEPLPKKIVPAVTARFKIIAELTLLSGGCPKMVVSKERLKDAK